MIQTNQNTSTSDRLTTVLSYGVLLLLGYLVFRITEPFLIPLAWSAILAVFFYPIYQLLEKRWSPTRAAIVCTVGVTVLLIVPALLVLLYAGREAVDVSVRLKDAVSGGSATLPLDIAERIRRVMPESLQGVDISGQLRQAVERAGSFLAVHIGELLKNLLSFFVSLFILLFALFFMFRDGDKILRVVRHLLPFEPEIQEDMLTESRDLIFASVTVALFIAVIQGLLGGLAFAIVGLPGVAFLGVLIAFCSIIPVVGSAIVWVPAALWLGFSGHWGKALVVLGICGGVAAVADNLVRPLLLRNRTRLNDLLLFVSILGGLEVFGLLGLVVGPTVVAAALGVFRGHMEHRERLTRPKERGHA
jgi:predicted PurR-regulated permease PerM